jgi:hypothetical protein
MKARAISWLKQWSSPACCRAMIYIEVELAGRALARIAIISIFGAMFHYFDAISK